MYSRRIDETRRVCRKRTSNRELNGKLAQSLHRTVNHAANKSKSDHHSTRSSSRKSRSRADKQSSTDRAPNGNHLQMATFESLRELVGLLHIGAVRITVRSNLPRRLHMGERRSRFERVDESSQALARRRSAILGASLVGRRGCRNALDGIAHLRIVHGGEEL
jgi:hypothetical protein